MILESIYGNNIHDELVSRSFTILKFMASKNRIELKHLDMLWNSAAVSRDMTLLTTGSPRNVIRGDI